MKKSVFYSFMVLFCLARVAAASSSDIIGLSPERPMTVLVQSAKEPDRGGNSKGSLLKSPSPRYIPIADVLDGFGGESKSTGYEIPFGSAGPTFDMGITESNNYQVRSGYVWIIDIKRGDDNQDGIINVGDVVYLINYLFKGGNQPIPMEAGDVNCDTRDDVGDIVFIINYLFKVGPQPGC